MDGSTGSTAKSPNVPSVADSDAQKKEAKRLRVIELQEMLDLVVHGSKCKKTSADNCLYPNCRKLKLLFRHGIKCTTRSSGGCHLCNKMWFLLRIHAKTCKQSPSLCSVPRCSALKEHMRRMKEMKESCRTRAEKKIREQKKAAEAAADNVPDAESSTDP